MGIFSSIVKYLGDLHEEIRMMSILKKPMLHLHPNKSTVYFTAVKRNLLEGSLRRT